MQEHIQYDYIHDNHFNELKELEMETQRVALLTQMDPFVGKYFSVDYVRRHILNHTDVEIKEQDKLMKKEINQGLVMDPIDMNTFDTMDRQNDAFAPEIDAQNAEDDQAREMEKAKLDAKLKPAPTKTPSNTK